MYTTTGSDNQFVQKQKLTAPDGGAHDFFGESVAVFNSSVVVGAYLDDEKGADAGKQMGDIITFF